MWIQADREGVGKWRSVVKLVRLGSPSHLAAVALKTSVSLLEY